jgi:hypothetical protein
VRIGHGPCKLFGGLAWSLQAVWRPGQAVSTPQHIQAAFLLQAWAAISMHDASEEERHDALHPCGIEEEGLEEFTEQEPGAAAEGSTVAVLTVPPFKYGKVYIVFCPGSPALDRQLGAVVASKQTGTFKCISCHDSLVRQRSSKHNLPACPVLLLLSYQSFGVPA